MKKMIASTLVLSAGAMLTYCSSAKKTATSAVARVNYQANIMSLVQTHCAPCHFPDKGGRKKPLDTYAAVSTQIDEVLRRIQMSPGQRGFMPDRKPDKLQEADINAFVQWKTEGLAEK